MNFASGQIRHLLIEKRCQGAQDAALGLSAQPQQNEIVARQNGIDDLRHDCVVISHNSREDRGIAFLAQPRDQIVS